MSNKNTTNKILDWYKQNKRPLPWRETSDPYKIWLSEIIMQQTRVSQGTPYYLKFIDKYPTVQALSSANEQEVLHLWQGLGYYSRARNLHACAKIVSDKYNGNFPKNYNELLKLPGIGKYTAAAIASFAFKEAVPAIDGNVFRVLARLFGIDSDIAIAKSRVIFEEFANGMIPHHQPDDFNQAMMEFGALQCVPKNPDCSVCPLAIECYARINNKQASLPVKLKKVKVKKRHFTYLVIKFGSQIWMKERLKGDIWQGLNDFFLIEKEAIDTLDITNALQSIEIANRWEKVEESDTYKHILTHQIIYAQFIVIELVEDKNNSLVNKSDFYALDQINDKPKPVLISNYLNDVIF